MCSRHLSMRMCPIFQFGPNLHYFSVNNKNLPFNAYAKGAAGCISIASLEEHNLGSDLHEQHNKVCSQNDRLPLQTWKEYPENLDRVKTEIKLIKGEQYLVLY